jgi:hypothetical protein
VENSELVQSQTFNCGSLIPWESGAKLVLLRRVWAELILLRRVRVRTYPPGKRVQKLTSSVITFLIGLLGQVSTKFAWGNSLSDYYKPGGACAVTQEPLGRYPSGCETVTSEVVIANNNA